MRNVNCTKKWVYLRRDALIKILRALQELEILEPFSEYEIVSPMTLAKNAGKLPQKIRNINKMGN